MVSSTLLAYAVLIGYLAIQILILGLCVVLLCKLRKHDRLMFKRLKEFALIVNDTAKAIRGFREDQVVLNVMEATGAPGGLPQRVVDEDGEQVKDA